VLTLHRNYQLSQAISTGILREQLHSNGVVISDDMQMRAIAQYYGYEQVVLLALQAGMDVLAIANQLQYDPDMAAKTIAIVKKLLHEGNLTPARIDESDAHIVKYKERLGNIQEGRMAVLASERNRLYARST
jgi:beta-N-acetylhexosaminidase